MESLKVETPQCYTRQHASTRVKKDYCAYCVGSHRSLHKKKGVKVDHNHTRAVLVILPYIVLWFKESISHCIIMKLVHYITDQFLLQPPRELDTNLKTHPIEDVLWHGRKNIHTLRVGRERPRAVEDMAISPHILSFKALTFTIYMRRQHLHAHIHTQQLYAKEQTTCM